MENVPQFIRSALELSKQIDKAGREVSRRAVLLGAMVFPLVHLGVIAKPSGPSDGSSYVIRYVTSIGYLSKILVGDGLWDRIYSSVSSALESGGASEPERLASRLLGASRGATREEIERRIREKLEILARHGLLQKRRVGELVSSQSPSELGLEVKMCEGGGDAALALRAAALAMLEAEGTPQAAPVAYIASKSALEGGESSEWNLMFAKSFKKLVIELGNQVGSDAGDLAVRVLGAALEPVAQYYSERERDACIVEVVAGHRVQAAAEPRGESWSELEELAAAIVDAGLDDKLPLQRVIPILLVAGRYKPANTAALEELLRRAGPSADKLAGSKATLYRIVERLKQKGLLTQKPPIEPTERAVELLKSLRKALESSGY